MNGEEQSNEDSTTEEGEAEPSEDEIPSVDELPSEDELTNVIYSENETSVGTPIPGPSVSTQIPGPSVSNPGTQGEKQSEMKPSPIKYPGCNERSHSGDDVPLKKLTTPKKVEAPNQNRPQKET